MENLEILQCDSNLLEPHFLRGAIIFVRPPNDLAQIGRLMADNKTHLIKGLLEANELIKPTEELFNEWKNDKDAKFNFIIIQPFVLVQLI